MAVPGADAQFPEKHLIALATEYECRVNPVWPMPGARDCLRELAGAGLALGIVSNAQFYTPPMLQALLGESLHVSGASVVCSQLRKAGNPIVQRFMFGYDGLGWTAGTLKGKHTVQVLVP